MNRHRLKTWPAPFQAVWDGEKTHEVRVDDRGFADGDILILEEWDASRPEKYTGRWITASVWYVTKGGTFGLPEHLCVMSIRVLYQSDAAAADEAKP